MRREPVHRSEADERSAERPLADEDDRHRLPGRELRQRRARLPVEGAPRLVATGRDAEPRRAHARAWPREAARRSAPRSGPSRPWRPRGSRPARRRPLRCRARPRVRRRCAAGGAGTRARRRTSRCALPRPLGPAATVGARLLTPAADLHGAPARRAVARDVVEQPAARVLAAGLEPVPGSRRLRRRDHGDDRGQPPRRAAARRRDAGPVGADPDDEGERAERGVDRRATLLGRRLADRVREGELAQYGRGARAPPRKPRRRRRRRRGSALAREPIGERGRRRDVVAVPVGHLGVDEVLDEVERLGRGSAAARLRGSPPSRRTYRPQRHQSNRFAGRRVYLLQERHWSLVLIPCTGRPAASHA